MEVRNRLIVALDVASMADVRQLVETLGDAVSYYKVGMQLFYSVGMECLTYLREQGKDVFLDLKMHDIPNTVAQGAASLTRLGVAMINVHASGGQAMMQAAAEKVAETAKTLNIPRPKLIAVTILTSMNDAEWASLRNTASIPDQVVHLAKMAQAAGMDGVVASPQEAELIRAACGKNFAIITPGVRPHGAALNDQSRIATPAAALQAGAHYLVVGRPITAAPDPRAAALAILEEMREA
ncbi:orotidine-5'-phosphate decarboxylase [Sporomusa sphaeroides]|uniref:Orotidine 5'-phosphate decarboxylase n=1 Tax=Sporomusa sphaeroides DSM 2875 TaxID=1337886 RepID=A0ABM9W3Y5_9FIRM|nr:orotidine-5'-phosphate decarboxylase [Sporomusa sphaeroides]MCM0759317.1 orotidine-5'-phosphate decarboxylase [Sporomusa sphaeroides DSM 2875]OLS58648.1 orotidine 5'-phosphate decarboxylase [Sporomusa sphaeroides DSM 2875]CVK19842.1 Orotidine 5'-phosphate decarboxylase [Sporomusa sphaeroides DSM 2875]